MPFFFQQGRDLLHVSRPGSVYYIDMADNRLRRGFSLIELLIVIAIILIIAAIAMPKLVSARMFAYEMAAVRTLSTLNTAQTQYFSTYGRYATSLAELGPPTGGTATSPAAADLISTRRARLPLPPDRTLTFPSLC